jgi:hypothetical protein
LTNLDLKVLKQHILKQFKHKGIFVMCSEKVVATPKKTGSIVHGLYAKDLLLPWDDRDEFAALHGELKKELFPSGASEAECVFELAHLYWQKRTLWRLRTATVLRDRFTFEIVATERKSWAGIRRGLREKAREEQTLVQTMEASVAELAANARRLGKKLAKGASSPEEVQNLTPLLSAGIKLVNRLLPLLEQVRQLPDAEGAFDRNYLPEALEKVVRLETMIDARISKVLARLVALKEFKRTPAGSPMAQLTASRSLASGGSGSS